MIDPVQLRVHRLTQVVQAYTLTEDMPPSTRTNLRNHVRGIKLLAAAGETAAVTACVNALLNAITEEVVTSIVDWKHILTRRCNEVLAVNR